SNDNWEKDARYNVISSAYAVSRNGEWLQFGVGKGDLRRARLGNWVKSDPSFDWKKIDNIKFVSSAYPGQNVKISVKDLRLVPDQNEARAVVIFDDSWASV